MTLRELLGDGPDVVVTGLTFDNRLVAAGHPVLLRARASPATGTTSRPTRSRAGRSRWSCSGRSASACPRCWSTTCARRWPSPRRASTAIRRRRCGGGDHRHQRQDDDRVPHPRAARGRGPADRAARDGQVGRRRRGARGRAHDAGGDRPPAHVPRDARRAATSRARWRSPRTRWSSSAPTRIHVAAAVFTNLTQDHLDFHPTMEDYFQAKRLLFASRADRRCGSRTPTTPTAGG